MALAARSLLGQARPGPVEAQLGAEHARGRPGTVGIVRHLFGILSGRAGPGRRSVGIRADLVSSGSPRATGCETQIRGTFTLRAEVHPDCLRIEVEDGGGPWRDGPRDDGRPHGFDVVAAIAGARNWGVDGDARGRIAWARLGR